MNLVEADARTANNIAALDRELNLQALAVHLRAEPRRGPRQRALEISFADVLHCSQQIYDDFVRRPYIYLPALEERVNATPSLEHLAVSIVGDPIGSRCLTPRDFTSAKLKQIFKIRGIVTRVTPPRPVINRLVSYDGQRHIFTAEEFDDPYSTIAPKRTRGFVVRQAAVNLQDLPRPRAGQQEAGGTQNQAPAAGGRQPLIREYGLSTFTSTQRISLQDCPESVPAGRLPRSVQVSLPQHLIDSCRSGDTVEVVGVYNPSLHYRAYGGAEGRRSNVGNIVVASSLRVVGALSKQLPPTVEERVIDFLALCTAVDEGTLHRGGPLTGRAVTLALDVLAASLAPFIYGHDMIKKAIVLQLLQGIPRTFGPSSKIRGDINILCVGDPGAAKSQLLRVASKVLPISVITTGRGSSGVGLTAAVIVDPQTGERRLEAGATVLADRGILIVDELDKILADDRALLHEALEQQSISIAKAGLHATLNARCSVLAAANPIYGYFDKQRSFAENIALPDSLLSRFDLVFVVQDSTTHDKEISKHVIGNHIEQYDPAPLPIPEDSLRVPPGPGGLTGRVMAGRTASGRSGVSASGSVSRAKDGLPTEPRQIAAAALRSIRPDLYPSEGEGGEGEDQVEGRAGDQPANPSGVGVGSSVLDTPLARILTQDSILDSPKYVPDLSSLHSSCFAPYKESIHSVYLEALRGMYSGEYFQVLENKLILTHAFLQSVVLYCRTANAGPDGATDNQPPYLSPEASACVARSFADLRQLSLRRPSTTPVTARSLEALIRLATALAKLRWPVTAVTERDVLEAYVLLRHSLFRESEEEIRLALFGAPLARPGDFPAAPAAGGSGDADSFRGTRGDRHPRALARPQPDAHRIFAEASRQLELGAEGAGARGTGGGGAGSVTAAREPEEPSDDLVPASRKRRPGGEAADQVADQMAENDRGDPRDQRDTERAGSTGNTEGAETERGGSSANTFSAAPLAPAAPADPANPAAVSEHRYDLFGELMAGILGEERSGTVAVGRLAELMGSRCQERGVPPFGSEEIESCLRRYLQEFSEVNLEDGVLYF